MPKQFGKLSRTQPDGRWGHKVQQGHNPCTLVASQMASDRTAQQSTLSEAMFYFIIKPGPCLQGNQLKNHPSGAPKMFKWFPSPAVLPPLDFSIRVLFKTGIKAHHCLWIWGLVKVPKLLCTWYCTAKALPFCKAWAVIYAALQIRKKFWHTVHNFLWNYNTSRFVC